MSADATNKQKNKQNESNPLLRELGKGIDDMEAGRELSLEDAFQKISEMRGEDRRAVHRGISSE